MKNGISTHTYKEMVDKTVIFHKTGEHSFLWGFLKSPAGWYEEKLIHRHVCERCGQAEFIELHGYIKADRG